MEMHQEAPQPDCQPPRTLRAMLPFSSAVLLAASLTLSGCESDDASTPLPKAADAAVDQTAPGGDGGKTGSDAAGDAGAGVPNEAAAPEASTTGGDTGTPADGATTD